MHGRGCGWQAGEQMRDMGVEVVDAVVQLHCEVPDSGGASGSMLSVAAGVSNDHDLHSSLSYTTKNRNRQEKMAGK